MNPARHTPLPDAWAGAPARPRSLHGDRAIATLVLLFLHTLVCVLAAHAQPPADDQPAQSPSPPPFTLPNPADPFLPFHNAWPTDRINPRHEPAPGILIPITGKEGWFGIRTGRGGLFPLPDDHAALNAWKTWASLDPLPALELEGPNAFVPCFSDPKDPTKPRERELLLFISGQTSPRTGDSILLQRAAFLIQDPLNRDPADSRGLCLFMPGLFGTPEPIVESTTSALRKSGWTVLRMLAQPSRFTERVDFSISHSKIVGAGDSTPSSPSSPSPPPDDASIDAALDSTAQDIARVLTGRAAECAFAAQAACLHAESSRPYLKSRPRIAVGFSAGAMTLPTVVAREPDRYHAAVLVGAGCHFWLLNSKSNYATMVGALTLTWSDIERSPERESQLAERYLAHAPLDSFHTAAALHNKPVLMILGQHDRAVPTALGETLWERLQRPEKWMRPFGHEFLFINLHKDYNAIIDWLNSKLPEPAPVPHK